LATDKRCVDSSRFEFELIEEGGRVSKPVILGFPLISFLIHNVMSRSLLVKFMQLLTGFNDGWKCQMYFIIHFTLLSA
jgi:hypothetical protein